MSLIDIAQDIDEAIDALEEAKSDEAATQSIVAEIQEAIDLLDSINIENRFWKISISFKRG